MSVDIVGPTITDLAFQWPGESEPQDDGLLPPPAQARKAVTPPTSEDHPPVVGQRPEEAEAARGNEGAQQEGAIGRVPAAPDVPAAHLPLAARQSKAPGVDCRGGVFGSHGGLRSDLTAGAACTSKTSHQAIGERLQA